MKIGEGQPGRRAETQHQGRGDAEPVVLDDIPIGDAVLVHHQIEPQGRSFAEIGERLVDVGRCPPGPIGPEHQGAVCERAERRQLAVLLDDAAGGAAAEQDRSGTFKDLNILQIERIAVIAAKIAHAVEKNVIAGGKAADRQAVALRGAFPRGEADAGDVAQGVAQRRDPLVVHQLAGHRLDRERGIEKRLGELAEPRLVGLVARSRACLGALDRDRRQLHRRGAVRRGRRRRPVEALCRHRRHIARGNQARHRAEKRASQHSAAARLPRNLVDGRDIPSKIGFR